MFLRRQKDLLISKQFPMKNSASTGDGLENDQRTNDLTSSNTWADMTGDVDYDQEMTFSDDDTADLHRQDSMDGRHRNKMNQIGDSPRSSNRTTPRDFDQRDRDVPQDKYSRGPSGRGGHAAGHYQRGSYGNYGNRGQNEMDQRHHDDPRSFGRRDDRGGHHGVMPQRGGYNAGYADRGDYRDDRFGRNLNNSNNVRGGPRPGLRGVAPGRGRAGYGDNRDQGPYHEDGGGHDGYDNRGHEGFSNWGHGPSAFRGADIRGPPKGPDPKDEYFERRRNQHSEAGSQRSAAGASQARDNGKPPLIDDTDKPQPAWRPQGHVMLARRSSSSISDNDNSGEQQPGSERGGSQAKAKLLRRKSGDVQTPDVMSRLKYSISQFFNNDRF